MQICFVFVSCEQRKVVEGSGVSSGGYVVHFYVDGEWVMLWVAAMSLLYWAWQIRSVLTVSRNCAVHEECSVCVVCWSLSYAVKFVAAEYGRYGSSFMLQYKTVEWAKLSTLFIQCIWMAKCKFCGVHSLQNGTRCRDGVVSFPSSLVDFWGFHPCMHLFSFRKLFVSCFCCFFCAFCKILSFRNGKREGRWEGRPRGRCVVNFHHKLKCFHVKL